MGGNPSWHFPNFFARFVEYQSNPSACPVWHGLMTSRTRPCREAVSYLGEDAGSEHIVEQHSWDGLTAEDPHRIEQTAALR